MLFSLVQATEIEIEILYSRWLLYSYRIMLPWRPQTY
jgi:hypothetical protein